MQLEYAGAPPPRINSVALTYSPDLEFTGQFLGGSAAADNRGDIIVSFRNPPGGEDSSLWAYTPVMEPVVSNNMAPVARAGPDQRVKFGATVRLNGAGSSDADGDALSYEWRLASPTGITIIPANTSAASPRFIATTAGDYTATLIVDYGTDSSTLERVLTTVEPAENSASC